VNDASQTVSLPLLASVVRRHRLVALVTVTIAVAASIGFSTTRTPTYTATAIIGFNDESDDFRALGTPAAQSFQPEKEAAAEAERITRPEIVDRVRKLLRIRTSAARLKKSIDTEVGASTNLVSITARWDSARVAAQVANAFAAAVQAEATQRSRTRYSATARAAERRAAQAKGERNAARRALYEDQASRLLALATFTRPVDVVRTATTPGNPTSPRPVRDAILAGILGLILAVGIAFLRHTFDRRLRTASDVEGFIDAPIVGYLRSAVLGHSPVHVNGGPPMRDEELEPFRILRSNVTFLAIDRGVRLVLVTSPLPEEGKSTVATGLAWAEAMAGRRTLLVECDLRRPTLGGRLKLQSSPGLSDFLLGEAQPADILRVVAAGNGRARDAAPFACIPAGRPAPNPAEMLNSARFRDFIAEVTTVYDRVILDTAPLLPVSDTLALLSQVDGMLLCLRLGQTTRDEALAAKAALEHFPTKPSGLVLTGAEESQAPYYVGEYAYNRSA
jgi:succinoglycan biosynthesis transport protein ExoP